jgi:hypothetical protein
MQHNHPRAYQQPTNPSTEIQVEGEEIEISQETLSVEEVFQRNPNLVNEVSPEALLTAPNIFQVELETYPLCPWKRLDQRVAQPQQYRQWFNYNLTPKTWTKYAEDQRKAQEQLKEMVQSK